MSDELCVSTTRNPFIPTVFLYDLSLLCSFIVSHPLYFFYFLFFSPYLIKFIFFISPLFFTTTLLLLLSFLATTFPHSKLGVIQTVLDKVRSKLNDADEDQEFCDFEDLEIYKIVFHDPPLIAVGDGDRMEEVFSLMENAVDVATAKAGKSEEERSLERLFEELDRFEDSTAVVDMKEKDASSDLDEVARGLQKAEPVVMEELGVKCVAMAEVPLSDDEDVCKFQKIEPVAMEKLGAKSTEATISDDEVVRKFQKTKPLVMEKLGAKSMAVAAGTTSGDEVVHKFQKTRPPVTEKQSAKSMAVAEAIISVSGYEVVRDLPKAEPVVMEKLSAKSMADAEATFTGEDQKATPNSISVKSGSWRTDSSSSFGSYGSMRKEKEWKRTLACKLFEERHNSEGGEEGMDSLWEAYEDDHSTIKSKYKKEAMTKQKKSLVKNKKSTEFKYFDDDEDDDDDEFMNSNGQLCCLKALKLSAGKMNLGMGKPNLVKISKALKGFGWLHHVGSKQHAKRT